NTAFGNRFWDCNRGVESRNVYDVKISNAIMRSAHTTSDVVIPSYSMLGEYGLNLSTNRINYDISNNEFTNIANAINIPINVYSNTVSAVAIHSNNFNAGNPANGNFMNIAVNVTGLTGTSTNTTTQLLPLAP